MDKGRLGQPAAPAFTAASGLDAEDKDDDDGPRGDDPTGPRESHLSVELIAIDNFVRNM